jgi:membrane protein
MRTASAMAFDFFLALVPMLGLAGFMIVRVLHADPKALAKSSAFLELAPGQMNRLVARNFEAISEANFAPIALLGALWIASDAFHTLIRLCEEIFDSRPRGYIRARLWALGLALLFVGSLCLVTFIGYLVGSAGADFVESLLGKFVGSSLVRLGTFAALLVLSTGFLSVVYYVAIGQRKAPQKTIIPGAFVASLVGAMASIGLGIYVASASRMALFYGSLLTVIVVMFWLLLWCHALIIGAIVNVAIEDHLFRAPIETTGAERTSPEPASEDTSKTLEAHSSVSEAPSPNRQVRVPTQTPKPSGKSAGT